MFPNFLGTAEPSTFDFTNVINMGDLTTQVLLVGGGALVSALGIAASFRIGKKAYNWVMNKL